MEAIFPKIRMWCTAPEMWRFLIPAQRFWLVWLSFLQCLPLAWMCRQDRRLCLLLCQVCFSRCPLDRFLQSSFLLQFCLLPLLLWWIFLKRLLRLCRISSICPGQRLLELWQQEPAVLVCLLKAGIWWVSGWMWCLFISFLLERFWRQWCFSGYVPKALQETRYSLEGRKNWENGLSLLHGIFLWGLRFLYIF